MDALSQFLALHAVTARLDWRCELDAPWRLVNPGVAPGVLPYHLVTAGEAWLELAGQRSMPLQAGDLLMLPQGTPHVLHTGDHTAPLAKVLPADVARLGTLRRAGPGPRSEILCGEFLLDPLTSGLLTDALPKVVLLRTEGRERHRQLQQLMQMLQLEAREGRPGASVVVQHLASTLFALLLRGWLQDAPLPASLLRLLTEPRLLPAVQGILQDPGGPWSLPTLAQCCHMSRATFVRLFRRTAAQRPGSFLASMRMLQAARWLTRSGLSIAAVGEKVGYVSEPAFHRSFKQRMGVSPGAFRRRGRTPAVQTLDLDDGLVG